MNRNQERGVALVITLLMLSVVTIMAVVFLAISRREKASVTVQADQTVARLMTDAAVARARAEIAVGMMATTNPLNYNFSVSTNYINPTGFRPGSVSPTNVSYTYADGKLLSSSDDLLLHLSNLQYDPRPPVFIPTNNAGNSEFRYFLDFNRNRRFDTNGWLPLGGSQSMSYVMSNGVETTTYSQQVLHEHFVGDPEWIGVLERPDRPHSESNRFVGRYAFMILPAGKSLDFNFIHNNVKGSDPNLLDNYYSRNQGVGSWEINLAAFLRDLNTNAWTLASYVYNSAAFVPSRGVAFDDARRFLRHRYIDPFNRTPQLDSADLFFGPAKASLFRIDGIDNYGDGPMLLASTPPNPDRLAPGDLPAKPWPGTLNPEGYYDVQELYDTNQTSPQFVTRLAARTFNSFSSYDRYSVYRLLSQIGTDSRPAESNLLYQADFRLAPTNKLHLNYRNDVPNGQTNFISWTPIELFTQSADRFLRASLTTNLLNSRLPQPLAALSTKNFWMGDVPVRNAFSLTNIQIYYSGPTNGVPYYVTNNEYSATTHRALQLAANLNDATSLRLFKAADGTTNDYPSVFRPLFAKSSTNVFIGGFLEVNEPNVTNLLNRIEWQSTERFFSDPRYPQGTLHTNIMLYGVPWVIGAKKGFPNFNEFNLQTAAQISRKLELRRPTLNSLPAQTNAMWVLGVSNLFGIEAWNSYTQSFRRSVEMRASVQSSMALRSIVNVGGTVNITTYPTPTGLTYFRTNVLTTNSWAGNPSPSSFIVPIREEITFLPNAVFRSQSGTFTTNSVFESSIYSPIWDLVITNRVQFFVIDKEAGRIIDFVNLDKLVTRLNVTGHLTGGTNVYVGDVFGDQPGPGALTDYDVWSTNRVVANNPNSMTKGVTNQIGVSIGIPYVGDGVWRSAAGDPVAGRDKDKAILQFAEFMRGRSTNLVAQAPFSPTRTIYQKKSWQANDPLVHYTAEDLSDPAWLDPNNIQARPVSISFSLANDSGLGRLNERYDPWGGNPQKTPGATSFRLTIKDPGVASSDDWSFPTNKLASLGLLGRIHRGSPWQTIYLKSQVEEPARWLSWSGSMGTHPTNDWKFIDLFTVAPNANAARGLLSVNQTNLAAWSAVLSGVAVLSNSVANPATTGMKFSDHWVSPSSRELAAIVNGINQTRSRQPYKVFRTLGDVLATPELSVASPFLDLSTPRKVEKGLNDVAYERIPQQILSLLKTDEPRVVIYAFGQSLKPAEGSLVTSGNFYNICTNYQVTGELVTKTVLRFEGAPEKPRAVIESYNILPPE
jgi:hypothetical protein